MRRRIISGLLALTLSLSMGVSVLAEDMIDPVLLNKRANPMAPQGMYRRNIGFIGTESPVASSQLVEVDGYTYYYDRGIFWVEQERGFVVVGAPVGAVVNTLPTGTTKLSGRKDTIYYFFGAFYGEKEGKYEVPKPPTGAAVGYLPEATPERARAALPFINTKPSVISRSWCRGFSNIKLIYA